MSICYRLLLLFENIHTYLLHSVLDAFVAHQDGTGTIKKKLHTLNTSFCDSIKIFDVIITIK